MSLFEPYLTKIKTQDGFIAALDQSGGSTPKTLKAYDISEESYSNQQEMFELIHQMRTRIITSPSFDGNRILGAILFEDTADREIEGMPSAKYLWEKKNIIPFLKIDKGLAKEENGVRLMKPIPNFDALLQKAKAKGMFGTKMRSVINLANVDGIVSNIKQQFELGLHILNADLCPILEPEIDIHSPQKQEAENILKEEIKKQATQLKNNQQIILKLTLPEQPNHYAELSEHKNILKVVALSGGYSRQEANRRLDQNNNMIASFSRALTEGLSVNQSDVDFDRMLDASIESIFQASKH